MLGNSAVVVVRTRSRAIPLAKITVRKSTHGFPLSFPCMMSMGLRMAALWAAGAPLLDVLLCSIADNFYSFFFILTRHTGSAKYSTTRKNTQRYYTTKGVIRYIFSRITKIPFTTL